MENIENDDMPYSNQLYVFDHYYLRHYIPVVNPNFNPVTNEKLLERHEQLLVPNEELEKINKFVLVVREILQKISIGDKEQSFFFKIEEIGAYIKNVLINVKPIVIDIVALTKKILKKSDIIKIKEQFELVSSNHSTDLSVNISRVNTEEANFTVYHDDNLKVKIFVGVSENNLFRYAMKYKTGSDNIHNQILKQRLAAINHASWFKQNADPMTLILVRIFKDLRYRFKGFKHLNPWMMEVFLKYCIRAPNNTYRTSSNFGQQPTQFVELNEAFLRAFQLLSAGILLPDSKSISDPTLPYPNHIQAFTDPRLLDKICCTAQTLLRIMNYSKGIEVILGLEADDRNIEESITVWDGVVVAPSIPLFNENEAIF